ACVDTESDSAHCGRCNERCEAGEVCSAGVCRIEWAGQRSAGAGSCVDVNTGPLHCGDRGQACGAPAGGTARCQKGRCINVCGDDQVDCDGVCVTLESDDANCGRCGHACGSGLVCQSGECTVVCESNATNCGGSCTDTESNV